MTWLDLAERCRNATGPDREIDAAIYKAARSKDFGYSEKERNCPAYTRYLDAIAALIEDKLPGWMARVQWCGVSAEAWVAPDLNSPLCPPEIRANEARWHDYADRNEVELRPGSREAAIRALCAATCLAMHEKESA